MILAKFHHVELPPLQIHTYIQTRIQTDYDDTNRVVTTLRDHTLKNEKYFETGKWVIWKYQFASQYSAKAKPPRVSADTHTHIHRHRTRTRSHTCSVPESASRHRVGGALTFLRLAQRQSPVGVEAVQPQPPVVQALLARQAVHVRRGPVLVRHDNQTSVHLKEPPTAMHCQRCVVPWWNQFALLSTQCFTATEVERWPHEKWDRNISDFNEVSCQDQVLIWIVTVKVHREQETNPLFVDIGHKIVQ